MNNPIKDNRIVSNITFATRLVSFLENTTVSDLASEEEQEYLLYVAKALKKYQIETCTEDSEIAYFKNLGIVINKQQNND